MTTADLANSYQQYLEEIEKKAHDEKMQRFHYLVKANTQPKIGQNQVDIKDYIIDYAPKQSPSKQRSPTKNTHFTFL